MVDDGARRGALAPSGATGARRWRSTVLIVSRGRRQPPAPSLRAVSRSARAVGRDGGRRSCPSCREMVDDGARRGFAPGSVCSRGSRAARARAGGCDRADRGRELVERWSTTAARRLRAVFRRARGVGRAAGGRGLDRVHRVGRRSRGRRQREAGLARTWLERARTRWGSSSGSARGDRRRRVGRRRCSRTSRGRRIIGDIPST
jgi:hypothetical protein